MQGETDNDRALQKALQAAAKMSDVMDRSVVTSFDRSGVLAGTSFLALIAGTFLLPIIAAVTFGMGFVLAAKAILVTAACCLGGGTIGFSYDITTSYPSHKFSVASRALRRASNKLPEPARSLFQHFGKRANALFALAYAASVQKRLVDRKEDGCMLDDLEHEVEASLKKGLGSFGMWSSSDFRDRKLPKAEALRQEFSDASARLEQSVKKSSGNGGIRVEPKDQR